MLVCALKSCEYLSDVFRYVLVCGVLPFEGANLQQLRDRVLSGRCRFPFFLSSGAICSVIVFNFVCLECENLIRKMLTLDPTKRPTIDQIKKHKWMRQEEMEPKLRTMSSLYTDFEEPQPQIIRLMQTLGVEANRVKTSLMNEAYDNFHGIYLLLLERLRASNAANAIVLHGGASASNTNSSASSSTGVSSILPTKIMTTNAVPVPSVTPNTTTQLECKNKRRQSDAPRPRPPLNALREHSTFQTTDCIVITNPPVNNTHTQYAPHDYEENCSTLSRQSTIGTIGSIDEGVESDPNGSRFSSSEIENNTNGSGNSLMVVNNSLGNLLDSHAEIDILASFNSCTANSQENTGCVCSSSVKQATATLNTTTTSNESSPCASPQRKDFREGWRASDNAVLDSLATAAFPTGHLSMKSKALPEINRPSADALNAQQTKSFWTNSSATGHPNTQTTKQIMDRRLIGCNSGVPKRISLPENLQFQPKQVLNLKQAIHVEKQLGGDNSSSVEPKQVLKARFLQQQQKRLTKARMQLFRQQSYQLNQRQSIMSNIPPNMMNLRIQEDAVTPLSPIEDLKHLEEMDTS